MTAIIINPYALTPPPAAATREYRAVKLGTSSGAASATISACDIGAAATGRYVFAGLMLSHSDDRTLSSVTLGGQLARINTYSRYAHFTNQYISAAVVSAALDSGNTADIVATLSGSSGGIAAYAVTYKVTGLLSNIEVDETIEPNPSTYVSSNSLGVDVQEGGLLFDCTFAQIGSGTPTFTYSGVTKDVQSASSSTFHVVSGSLEVTADESSRNVQLSCNRNFRGPRVLVSFR